MFELIFDKKAGEELEKLPQEIRERIFNKLIQAKQDPLHFFVRLESRPEYKLRVGDYRVIVGINPKYKKIVVVKIGHRKNIYEKQ